MSILDDILATKRIEVEARKRACPEIERERELPVLSLERALRREAGPVRVLAEIKRASPSAGAIRPGADPAAIAREYADAGAAAISVLTDRQFFDGELAFVAAVRRAVALPALRKDFLIDPYQVYEAYFAAADAVLLIVAALSPGQLAVMLGEARRWALDALVEVHDEREAEVALVAGARIVGVNHRDLRTFAIDMTLTETIARRVPREIVLVAESGIHTRDDVRRLGDAGAHAVLVGEHLMRAASPGAALRELVA
ncbi:MAG TPA: indole-3-glycerol phosphate synthase TrpC [Kofleriaceae bacterium]|nr:indole-3-glycerol phosphate synthase TrpC [Kofleriaceae bacterium]